MTSISKDDLAFLHKVIETEVYTSNKESRIVNDFGEQEWLMDFRRILFKPDILDLVAGMFTDLAGEGPFQVGGLESASIPLISAIVVKSAKTERKINGFFVRKSRKKSGLLNMVEGEINDDRIVLVDDLINGGNSIMRATEVIESLGKKVDTVITVLRFRDESYYEELNRRGIRILSLFTLNDFSNILNLRNLVEKESKTPASPFRTEWYFKSEDAHYEHVVPKSAPFLDEGNLYFGSDNGTFWALKALSGEVLWSYKILFGSQGKAIFSSPCIFKDTVFFGAYDGNFYALDKHTGKRKWVAYDADWIGSSPCVADDLGLVYVGMEFGFWKQKGGIAAYDAETGKRIWQSASSEYTHGSPAYSEKNKLVVCGSNDGVVYGLDARSGKVVWTYDAQGEVKAGCAFSPSEKYVAFGSFNKEFVVLETKTGKEVAVLKTLESNYSTPSWANEKFLVCTSLDKRIYKFDVETGNKVWEYETSARIFASPVIFDGKVWVGNNAALLYVLDVKTGEIAFLFRVTERITNAVAIDRDSFTIFLPTFANEIFSLGVER